MTNTYITVTPLHLIGEGERGITYDFTIRKTSEFILIHRYKNTVSGNTYHKGVSLKTNPKTFVLLSGTIEFSYRHIEDKKPIIQRINNPVIIEVKPFVTHSVKAITDIYMLECNSIKDVEADRYKAQVFE